MCAGLTVSLSITLTVKDPSSLTSLLLAIDQIVPLAEKVSGGWSSLHAVYQSRDKRERSKHRTMMFTLYVVDKGAYILH